MENKEITTSNTPKSEKINFTQLAAYGAGGIIPIALFNVAGILVGLMGNISLGLSAFWLGFILIIPRLWDSFSDPIIGHLSDNTRSRWGRRRPYLLIGGILSALFFVIIWYIPKNETVINFFPTETGYQTFQLIYILITLLLFFTAVNLFEIPHGALGMEMTNDPHERTRLFSAKSFVGNIFAMSTPWLFWLANQKVFKGVGGNEIDGMRYVSLMIAALIIPLSFWWFLKLREPKFKEINQKQEKSNFKNDMKLVISNKNFVLLTLTVFTLAMGFNFVSLLGSYIPIFYVFGGDKTAGAWLLGINGTIWAITGVAAVFPLNWISPRLGKRKTLMLAMILMITAQLSKIVCYNPHYPYLIVIPTVLLSAGMLFFFTLGSSMVGDICDEDELNTGKRTEGSYYSVFWWFIKLGTALASFVAGALIVFTMFDQTQVTKVDKLQSNLDEISTAILDWKTSVNNKTLDSKTFDLMRQNAISEANEYKKLLIKERDKKAENTLKNIPEYDLEYKGLINQNLAKVQNTSNNLAAYKFTSDTVNKYKASIPSILLQTKLDKLAVTSFDLREYLKDKSLDKKIKNKNHYLELSNQMAVVDKTLLQIKQNTNITDLETDMKVMGKVNVALKNQTPYTLLMMRIVEIGLPIILSLISLFFVFKYTLTDKRTMEIKELLKARHSGTTI